MFEFDEATTLTPLGDGAYSTPIHDRWDINGNANGGYLLALVANAMREASGRAHPVSVNMHYLSPGPAGNGVTTTKVMKTGKRFATVAGTLSQDGRDIATALGVFGDIDSSIPPHSVTMERIEIPAYEDCVPRQVSPNPDGGTPMGLGSRLEMRIHPDDTGFARGEPTGQALCRGYFAFKDGRPVDTLSLSYSGNWLVQDYEQHNFTVNVGTNPVSWGDDFTHGATGGGSFTGWSGADAGSCAGTATATCPEGMYAIGGSYSLGTFDVHVNAFGPGVGLNTYVLSATNPSVFNSSAEVDVYCAAVTVTDQRLC